MNRHDAEDAEGVARRATSTLALLIRFAQAEGRSDRGGTNPELDADAWDAISTLLLDTRADVTRLNEEINRLDDAQRAAKGGAR